MPKYVDLAEAVEDLKKQGYENIFEPDSGTIKWNKQDLENDVSRIRIVDSWFFDSGTDPGDESTLYALETDGGLKGYVIISFGMHVDRDKAALIDKLLKARNED